MGDSARFHSTVHKYEWVYMHKEIQWWLFCYFCLKAGADRRRVRGEGRINSFTVQYLVSITSPKGKKQANSCYAERENYMERIFFQHVYKWRYWETEPAALGQKWGHKISFCLCTLNWVSHNNKSLEMWWIRPLSALDQRSQSPKTVKGGDCYQYKKDKYEEGVCKMGADSGSNRWPATNVHISVFILS